MNRAGGLLHARSSKQPVGSLAGSLPSTIVSAIHILHRQRVNGEEQAASIERVAGSIAMVMEAAPAEERTVVAGKVFAKIRARATEQALPSNSRTAASRTAASVGLWTDRHGATLPSCSSAWLARE